MARGESPPAERSPARRSPPSEVGGRERAFFHPSRWLIGFYLVLIGVGTILLYSPGAVVGQRVPSLLDSLFTAASAATGTGLVVSDTASSWSASGQWVLLGLIQMGGLGTLIGSTIFLLLIARRVGQEERTLLKESMGVQSVRGILLLMLGITLYALVVEAAGAYLITTRLWNSMPPGYAWWQGAFHSASAFNNAGFEVMDMAKRLPAPQVQMVLTGLSMLGAISFIIIVDLIRGLFRRPLSLDTKLVLTATMLLLLIGAGAILLTEGRNPQTLGNLPFPQKVLSALFHSASARTAGLATVGLSAFASSTLLLLIALMFIGGAAGSTAGGVKVNTFALMGAVTWSFVRGERGISVWGRTVHEEQVYRALAIVFLALMLVFAVTLVLSITEGPDLLAQLFETVSAFSTTGFSLGITPNLSAVGKLLIIFTMFAGRVGPLALAFALAHRSSSRRSYTEEAINLG